jgi:hypothetical protein
MARTRIISWAAVAAVAARPSLWAEALRAARRLAGQRGASETKLIPDEYLRFRAETASGSAGEPISAVDLVDWLKWAGRFRRVVE